MEYFGRFYDFHILFITEIVCESDAQHMRIVARLVWQICIVDACLGDEKSNRSTMPKQRKYVAWRKMSIILGLPFLFYSTHTTSTTRNI